MHFLRVVITCVLLKSALPTAIGAVDVTAMLSEARAKSQARDLGGAQALLQAILDVEPMNSAAEVELGNLEIQYAHTQNNEFSKAYEYLATERFERSFNDGAQPKTDIDSELGFHLAGRIGLFYNTVYRSDAARKWLKLAASSAAAPDACAGLMAAQHLPQFPRDQAEAELIIADYHVALDSFIANPTPLNRGLQCTPGPFWHAYYDQDHRAAVSKFITLQTTIFPELLFTSPALEAPLVRRSDRPRLRVGFVSTFFRPHSSNWDTFGGVISRLPKHLFDVVMLYFPRDGLEATEASIQLSPTPKDNIYLRYPDGGHSVEWLDDVRQQVMEAKLDILVYIDLHMSSGIALLALSKLAPVQAYTMGHPVTSGIPSTIMNYFISWGAAELDTAQQHYTEELLLMPADRNWLYLEPRNTPDKTSLLNDKPWGHFTRMNHPVFTYAFKSMGMQDIDEDDWQVEDPSSKSPSDFPRFFRKQANWYFCAQAAFKYHPRFDTILASIQQADPRGVIILVKSEGVHAEHQKQLQARFQHYGVDLARVVFVPRMPHHMLMGVYALSDVVLDSVNFGGETTTREAFEVGAPVVTLPHKAVGCRWTQAYYKMIGITDLTATDPDDYVRMAVKMATDKPAARVMRQRILDNLHKLFHQKEAITGWVDVLQQIAPSYAEGAEEATESTQGRSNIEKTEL